MKAVLKISVEHEQHKFKDLKLEIATMMADLSQGCTVYETISSVDNEAGEYHLEIGAVIEVYNVTKEIIENKIWPTLKERLGLDCAYISISKQFSGCIYDYLRSSICPFKLRKDNNNDDTDKILMNG